VSLAALGAVAAALAAGPPPAAVVEPSPAAPIVVAGHPISRGALRHWVDVAARLGSDPASRRRTTAALLIPARWVRGEAAERGIVVRRGEVTRELRKQRKAAYPHRRDYRRYLRESGQTQIDVRSRVKSNLLTDRLRALATQGATTPEEQQAKLDAYVAEFRRKWRARTTCLRPWVSKPDCGRVSNPPRT
jgi:hypothetical protein